MDGRNSDMGWNERGRIYHRGNEVDQGIDHFSGAAIWRMNQR